MAFEFWFGVFGLISSDSRRHQKLRLDNDWRLNVPLGASIFGDAGNLSADSAPVSHASFMGGSKLHQQPIFSTNSSLGRQKSSNMTGHDGGVFSFNSSSSASSIGSSSSMTGLIKPPAWAPRDPNSGGNKYELLLASRSVPGIGNQDAPQTPTTGAPPPPPPTHPLVDNTVTIGVSGPTKEATRRNKSASEDGSVPNSSAASSGAADGQLAGTSRSFRPIYCRAVCLFLWLNAARLIAGLLVERSIMTLDFYYLGAFRIHLLVPASCLGVQAAAVSLIFIRNNDETNWLVPFYSSKDYLIRSRSNFRPRMEDYSRRIRISIMLALALALMGAVFIPLYLAHAAIYPPPHLAPSQPQWEPWTSLSHLSLSGAERVALRILLVCDLVWAIYSSFTCFLVAFYFNLICSIMKARFHGISEIIEELAESNTSKTTNQAHKITTLYLEHNEACELLDDSNDFWQYLIFFTYFTYIPAYCYCLYNLFFVDFDTWPSFITWVIHNHAGFVILLISFSAAGVSTELPLDVEVNIATFLHRVRGLTIGYSCYDLFAITNASMSNTAAACASYFLIVADFSRSSVFNLAQMNGSAPVAASTTAASLAGSSTVGPTPTLA